MKNTESSVGLFTTDRDLVVQIWDPTMVRFTGVKSQTAGGQSLLNILTDLESRGLRKYFDHVLERGVVEILAPAFHQHLILCAPSKPSRHFSSMRQRVTIAPLKDEGDVVGVLVTVEDVTASHEREIEMLEEIRRQTAAGGASEEHSLPNAFDGQSWRVRQKAVERFSRNAAPEAIAALLLSVRDNHRNLGLLNGALKVLELCNVDTLDTLIEFLDGSDTDLRIQASLALGMQEDARAVPALMKAVRDPNANVAYHAIEALGRLRALEARELLTATAETRDFFLAFPALEALASIGDATTATRITPLLQDAMLCDPTAATLARIGDETTVAPLVALLNKPDAPAVAIARSLAVLYDRYERYFGEGRYIADLCAASIQPSGVGNLVDALSGSGAGSLRPLLLVLGWLDSPAGVRALTLHLGNPDLREEILAALVRHGSAVTEDLIEQLRSEDLEVRLSAVIALGRIGDRLATPVLSKMLGDDTELTIPIIGALASIGDPAAMASLFDLIRTPNVAVRRAAVSALNTLALPETVERVLPLFKDADAGVREAAVRIAGYFGYPNCVDALLSKCQQDRDENVRRAAAEHLPYLDDPRVGPALIQALRKDTPPVRAAAAAAMTHVEFPIAVPSLLSALKDGDPWVRYFASRSLGRHGAPKAALPLQRLAESDPSQQVRIAAFEALLHIDSKRAARIATLFLASKDLDFQQAVAGAIDLAEGEGFSLLLDALRSGHAIVRATAARSLGQSGNPEALRHLRGLASTDGDPLVIEAAIHGLKALGTPESESAVIDFLNDPVRGVMATDVLSDSRNLNADSLREGLRHPSVAVRLAIVTVLERLKRPEVSELLRVALNDGDPAVRIAASGALNRNSRHAHET